MGKSTPTTDEIRSRIDKGLMGDKVAFPDPAAAPLGTDAEAAGTPPTEMELRMVKPADEALPITGQGEGHRPSAILTFPMILAGAALVLLVGAVLVLQRLP